MFSFFGRYQRIAKLEGPLHGLFALAFNADRSLLASGGNAENPLVELATDESNRLRRGLHLVHCDACIGRDSLLQPQYGAGIMHDLHSQTGQECPALRNGQWLSRRALAATSGC